MISSSLRALAASLVAALVAVACSGSDEAGDGGVRLRLITHDSFAVSDALLESFTEETGVTVELIQGGDAGTVVNQAILTNGNPQADVLFGIDSTFLTRALAEGLFVPYEAEGLAEVGPEFLLDPEHRVTPIDYGDVCINYDKTWFEERALPVPSSLAELTDPIYRDLLVVENPATSSPGLAFLLATIATFGEDGWEDFWTDLRSNGVLVTDGWEDAYYGEFSGGTSSEGERPLVVSYASSPAAEVIFADPPIAESPIGSLTAGCYRQVEAAGILSGTDHEEEAGLLIDFMLSSDFQVELPGSMFVYPVRVGVEVPAEIAEHTVAVPEPITLAPDVIAAGREEWIRAWTDLIIG